MRCVNIAADMQRDFVFQHNHGHVANTVTEELAGVRVGKLSKKP